MLRCDFELSKIPIKLSKFHGQALLYAKIVFTHNYSPHRTIGIIDVYLCKNKGIQFVCDLFNSDVQLMSLMELKNKFDIEIIQKEYFQICTLTIKSLSPSNIS